MGILIAAAAGGAAFLAWAVRGKSSAVFAPSVWRGPGARREVALTFDDGPSPATPAILELLAAHGAKATFFFCGENVRRMPEAARWAAAAGHEIGNHSDTHPLLCFRSARFMEGEIRRAQETIREHTGQTPRWFRAPYGVRWFGLGGVQRRLGLTGVMWTVIGRDWKLPGEAVARRVLNGARPGAIICLHDGRELSVSPAAENTIQALRLILPSLAAEGYRFVTLSQMFKS